MIEFLFSLPLWKLAIVLLVWLVAFGLVGLWIARRYLLPRLRLSYEDAYFGAAVVQSSMLLYGLVAALIAVSVWQRFTEVSDIVSSEATAIANLWRDFGGYPEARRDAMRDVLRGYTEQVIHEAWPQMRQCQVPTEGVEWMDRLQAEIMSFEPQTEAQRIVHAEALRAFNHLVQQRRQRLDAIRSALPEVFWWVLFPGAMGCIALCFFFHVENWRYQATLISSLAGFLAMVLFVIVALDRPFCGDMGITAESYQLVYDHHMRK